MTEDNLMKYQKKIITIPNILSFLRICLIPVIVWSYCVRKDSVLTTCILVFSGVTDVVDGMIARRFGMVSDLGKALDPVADKLTQLFMLVCLVTSFPLMIIPVIVLVVKEISAAIMSGLAIKKTRMVYGAVWHGKLTTVLLYLMMFIHLLWSDIPTVISNILIVICIVMMVVSAIGYGKRHMQAIRTKDEQ